MLTCTTRIKRFYCWNECYFFFKANHLFQLHESQRDCRSLDTYKCHHTTFWGFVFFLSRFHLQMLITGWIGSTFWETKQSRSIRNAERCPGASQKHRDHWDPVIWGLAKAILSFHWFNFSRRDHSLLPFIHHWQVLAGCTTHQTPTLPQHREDRDKDFSLLPEVGDKTPCRQTLGTEDGQSGWARASPGMS